MLGSLISRILLLCACAALLGSVAWAVITGSISGVVTDPSGALIEGVTVVATNQATGVKTTTISNAKGFYTFAALGGGRLHPHLQPRPGSKIVMKQRSRST